MTKKHIATNYLRTWFLFDLISSIPFSFFVHDSTLDAKDELAALKQTKIVRLLRLIKYARLLRLIRFMKVNKVM